MNVFLFRRKDRCLAFFPFGRAEAKTKSSADVLKQYITKVRFAKLFERTFPKFFAPKFFCDT